MSARTDRRRGPPPAPGGLRQFFGVFQYSRRALELVWATHRGLAVGIAGLTVAQGVLPPAMAYVGKLIVDAVVLAAQTGAAADQADALRWVAAEAALVVLLTVVRRGVGVCQSLLRALLGHRVNVMILEKALTLDLEHFEDAAFYDKLTQARRQASVRPLSLVNRTFSLVELAISLVSYGALLIAFSPWAALVLALAGLPAFFAEARFSGEAFRLFKWRSPETRRQMYLETLLAREDYAKEVQLYDLGALFLQRYRDIFATVFGEDRSLTLRRGAWATGLGLLSTLAFYGAYAWIALSTIRGAITLGDMTMYLLVFKQGQTAFASVLTTIGGMYEDNLYLSTLYDYLGQHTRQVEGGASEGTLPGDGVRFEGVSFSYPGAATPALHGVDIHLKPGEKLAVVGENGSGKTTLIKLLTRLYEPTEGRVTLDGRDLREWDVRALRKRIGVIFQDFVRYQLLVGENVGVGDVERVDDEDSWQRAAVKGLAAPVIERLPSGFHTQLGRWFEDGQELSVGQWQKIALSRMFMREGADVLVLDEPTSAMDAEAEAQIFDHFRQMTQDRMAVLISHRFSTVRMADRIVVLHHGEVVEEGDHEGLMAADGRYAHLFAIQAQGYV